MVTDRVIHGQKKPASRSSWAVSMQPTIRTGAHRAIGIRILTLATQMAVAVAKIFAHLAYASIGKKFTFIMAVIVANSLHAYIVVLVANGTDMVYGTDHYVFGWLVCSVTIGVAFWLGASLRDERPPRGSQYDGYRRSWTSST